MKLSEKNKKWFFLASIFFFVLSVGVVLLDAICIYLSSMNPDYMFIFRWWGYLLQFLSPACSVILAVLFLLGMMITAAVACWKEEKARFLLAGTGVLLLITLFCPNLISLVAAVILRYFNWSMLLILLLESGLPLAIFAMYLIVFPFIKAKGLAVPVLGIVLIVLCPLFTVLVYSLASVTRLINLFQYYSVSELGEIMRLVCRPIGSILTSTGWLLLVPLTLYIPKKKAESEEKLVL